MNTQKRICCLSLIFLTLTQGVLLSTCGVSNVREIIHTEENGFVNVSYLINVTERFNSSPPLVAHVEVCAMNSFTFVCKYYWEKKSNKMTAKNEHSGTFCSAERRDLSSSTFTFDLQISQVFSRSLSLMIISLRDHTDYNKTLKAVRFIKLEVLDWPTVTSLSVDGQEVNGSCLINENQEVNITCSFDKGNPPASFRLLVQNGTELKHSGNNRHIVHLMTARCKGDWPIVRCEGDGSRQNRSVLFLVRCPPQFVNNSETVFSLAESDVITLRVKSHTTPVSGCLFTSMSSRDTTMNVTCNITGSPPDFLLNLHLGQINRSSHGNWTVTVLNDEGPGNITLTIFSPIKDLVSVQERESPIITVVLGCGSVLIFATVAAVVIYAIKKSKEKTHGNVHRKKACHNQCSGENSQT